MEEKKIGYVSDYFRRISAAAVEIKAVWFQQVTRSDLKDILKSKVGSMQIEHESVKESNQGDSIGVKVSEKVRKGDKVYRIIGGLSIIPIEDGFPHFPFPEFSRI